MNKKIKSFFGEIQYDLPSGLVVYLVALPLCLGVALASTGSPDLLFSGIIAGVIGGIVIGTLSGSALGVSGPAAGLVVIVLTAIQTLGSFEAFLLAVVFAGILQLIAGFLKAGIIGYYFPSSVIKGMLAAIGITLILKEIPHVFGYDEVFMGDEGFIQKDGHNTLTELWYALKYNSTGALIISTVSLTALILLERPAMKKFKLFKFLPGALFVVILGVLLNFLFQEYFPEWVLKGKHLVQLPVASGFEEFIGFFKSPDFSAITNPDVYVTAITLAIVASLETLLSVEATDKLDPIKRSTPTNRELKSQGIGNILSGLIGGLPVTQVIVRSSANINSGGKTRLSTIIHGTILLLSAIIIPRYLNLIPLASLACILLLVGYKLSKYGLYRDMFKLGWDQFIPFVVTVTAILFTDLLKGIFIGMQVAFYFILRKNYKNSYHYHMEVTENKNIITLRLSEEVTFLNKGSILQTLNHLPKDCKVIIDGSKSLNIDYDVLEIIQEFKQHTAPNKNITVETIGIAEVVVMGH
jgi:carbonic anhydrase